MEFTLNIQCNLPLVINNPDQSNKKISRTTNSCCYNPSSLLCRVRVSWLRRIRASGGGIHQAASQASQLCSSVNQDQSTCLDSQLVRVYLGQKQRSTMNRIVQVRRKVLDGCTGLCQQELGSSSRTMHQRTSPLHSLARLLLSSCGVLHSTSR